MGWLSLPTLNATLNATSAVLLGLGFYFIRQKKREAHRVCMIAALVVSCLFLVSYLTYHYTSGITRFGAQGWIRPVYFTILTSHTILAMIIVPLVLITLRRALKQRFDLHKAIARWTWPIWMYVSVTGVLVYLLLYHLFPSRS